MYLRPGSKTYFHHINMWKIRFRYVQQTEVFAKWLYKHLFIWKTIQFHCQKNNRLGVLSLWKKVLAQLSAMLDLVGSNDKSALKMAAYVYEFDGSLREGQTGLLWGLKQSKAGTLVSGWCFQYALKLQQEFTETSCPRGAQYSLGSLGGAGSSCSHYWVLRVAAGSSQCTCTVIWVWRESPS